MALAGKSLAAAFNVLYLTSALLVQALRVLVYVFQHLPDSIQAAEGLQAPW